MTTEYPIKKYDDNGNLIYLEYSSDYWWKKEFDDNENLIYYEDSNDDYHKFDDEGNNINFEYFTGTRMWGFFNKKTRQLEGIIIHK